MRYPRQHKEQTRKRLLDACSTLAKEKGFSAASVDDVMAAGGLTGGAFYAHFRSKDALFAELIQRELEHSVQLLRPREGHTREEWMTHVVNAYLSASHVRLPGTGCVIPALGAEIARADARVRGAFETSMKALHESWSERVGDSDLAWSIICQLVGAIVVARGMTSKSAIENVVSANRSHLVRSATDSTPPLAGRKTSRKTQAGRPQKARRAT